MTNTALKAQIDSQITNETSANAITPTDVGTNLKAVVDYVDQETKAKVLERVVTHSELLNMSTTPIVLLPASSSKLYVPYSIVLKYNNNLGFGDGGTSFNINFKNDVNSFSLGAIPSQLGGTTNKEQFRTLQSGAPTNITDSLFDRRIEISTTTNPSAPVDETTTITVYLFYTEFVID